jgi:hypothetical protein
VVRVVSSLTTAENATLSVVAPYLDGFPPRIGGLAHAEPRRLTEPVAFGVILVVALIPLYYNAKSGSSVLLECSAFWQRLAHQWPPSTLPGARRSGAC